MDASDVRPVIVGSGHIADRHVGALAELGIRPVAVWSPNAEHAAVAASRWGCVAARDLEEVLSSFDATHVHVCSTPMQHEDVVLRAATRRLAVICEKPLAPTFESARGPCPMLSVARKCPLTSPSIVAWTKACSCCGTR